MTTHERYELIETIAKGDFATVFRGRDRELGREVAIKQIHQQYLDDPAQLERYWQEAQLLASLEHPHIMTIYDVVRSRGWLVLELMQGSLQQKLAGNPIDLEDLRLTLIYTLSALQFLHKNGIVHGDVKPGNLLLDRNSRIKLGDFGIARRISGGDGSVVKGTTKYMAPEVLSDQFGDVGPHSDIYSLGFSAYELMCGSHFESLFPGLHMFGRDPQIAWMMWHSTPDRRLPEISKVLEGVPEDLASVIEKMTEKDPARRYRNTDRPLADLRARGEKTGPSEDEQVLAESAQAERKERNKRLLMFGALAVSVVLSLAVLFLPTGGGEADNPETPPGAAANAPDSGTIAHIERNLDPPYILLKGTGSAEGVEINVDPTVDRFYINQDKVDFAKLKIGDRIAKIDRLRNADDVPIQEIYVNRVITESIAGAISSLDLGKGTMRMSVPGREEPMEVYVPLNTRIEINQEGVRANRPFELRDLKPGDAVEVEYLAGTEGAKAEVVSAIRPMTSEGYVTALNSARRTLTFRVGETSDAPLRTLPLAEKCEITINGDPDKDGQPLTLTDLKVDDRVSVSHDAQIRRIDAARGLEDQVIVSSVDAAGGKFAAGEVTYSLAPQCKIRVIGLEEPVTLQFLRPGDRAAVSHNSFDRQAPVATSVTITPTPDKGVWGMVLADPRYAEDARLVQSALTNFYRVPKDQMYFADAGLPARSRPEVVGFLDRVAEGSQLVTYVAGDGAIKEDGEGYVMQDVSADWMLTQLENSAAADLLLVLDACHDPGQPSVVELAETRNGAGVPVSESVAVIAGCKPDETGLPHAESGRSLLAYFTSRAFRGEADNQPHDGRIRSDELDTYLTRNLALATAAGESRQTPHLFVPGDIPRLHPSVRMAIEQMLAFRELNDSYYLVYEPARIRAASDPDVEVAHALMLLKLAKNSKEALPLLQRIQATHPTEISTLPMLAWLEFAQTEAVKARRERAYRTAILELDVLVRNLPPPPAVGDPPGYVKNLIRLAGSLRHYAVIAADPSLSSDTPEVKRLDSFFLGRGDAFEKSYREGVELVATEHAKLEQDVAKADNAPLKMLREQRLKRVMSYVSFDNFPFDSVADLIRSRLD
ncbi:MAG: protein kinase [Pirellulaceae bacterium]